MYVYLTRDEREVENANNVKKDVVKDVDTCIGLKGLGRWVVNLKKLRKKQYVM